jgi:hypothetical protein
MGGDEKKLAAYYLMDLERTLINGMPYFWLKSRHGYTYEIEEAGLFSEDMANEIIKHDLDQRTVKININTAAKILQLELEKS